MLEQVYEIIGEIPIDKERLMSLFPILRELDKLEFYHPAHTYGVLDHSIKAAEMVEDNFLRLVLIFHDVGKLNTAEQVPDRRNPELMVTKFPNHEEESVSIASSIFKNKMDSELMEEFLKLIKYHDTPLITDKGDGLMKELIDLYGSFFVDKLLKIQRADMITHDPSYYKRFVKCRLDNIEAVYQKKYLNKK